MTISELVIDRLPLYAQWRLREPALSGGGRAGRTRREAQGREVVSSQEFARTLNVSAAQIRNAPQAGGVGVSPTHPPGRVGGTRTISKDTWGGAGPSMRTVPFLRALPSSRTRHSPIPV